MNLDTDKYNKELSSVKSKNSFEDTLYDTKKYSKSDNSSFCFNKNHLTLFTVFFVTISIYITKPECVWVTDTQGNTNFNIKKFISLSLLIYALIGISVFLYFYFTDNKIVNFLYS